jgi:Zn-dependent protease with chaperone function
MSLAVCLLAYTLVVMVVGPPLLARATRAGVAPRLGMAAWIAAMAGVLGFWVAAVGLLGDELVQAWGHLDGTLGGCVAGLAALAGGGRGGIVQAGMAAAVALTALGITLVGTRVVLALRRARADTLRHADAAVLAARGTPRGPGGALVVDAQHRSVYCLPGRAGTIVITRAALDVLDEPQLAAVMAHERAHLTGRHHQLLAFTAALARILPGSRLFAEGATEVARLAELSADDAAARRHGRDTVVDALLALCVPSSSAPSPLQVPGLGAAGVGVADRVERLLFPLNPVRARLAQAAAAGALLLGPATMAALVFTQYPLCAPVMI